MTVSCLRFIHSKNRAGLGYTLQVNHLADLASSELKMMRGYRRTVKDNHALPFPESEHGAQDIPDQKDWRLYGTKKYNLQWFLCFTTLYS